MKDKKTVYYMLGIKFLSNRQYMVLESDIDCLSKAIHVIDFSFKSFYNVGRRVTNDVTVSDISVSREQAEIKLDRETNQVYINDCESKFGTFVKIDGLYKLKNKNKKVAVQVEKKCFFIKEQERFTKCQKLCRCFGSKKEI